VYRSKTYISNGLVLIGICVLPTISQAGLVPGNNQLVINGSAIDGANVLNFQCNQAGDPLAGLCMTNYGDFAVNSSVGSFAQYNSSFGQILNINNTNAPLGSTFSLPDFIVFDQAGNTTTGNIALTLTSIPTGTDPQSTSCDGLSHCTPTNPGLVTISNPGGVSPFDLDAVANGTIASFNVNGSVTDAQGDAADFIGTFSSTFTGFTPAQVLATLGPEGTPSDTFAATFSLSEVPEPTTVSLVGTMLLGLEYWRRKG
jgi:hypothetical protein